MTSGRWTQRFEEMPKLNARKFAEALPDVLLQAFEKHPARGAMVVGGYEVDPSANGVQLLVGLGFEEHVPASLAARQHAHVACVFLSRERSAHSVSEHYVPPAIPASYIRGLSRKVRPCPPAPTAAPT